MFTSLSSGRSSSRPRQLFAITTAAFIVLQSVLFAFPAAAITPQKRVKSTRTVQRSIPQANINIPALGVPITQNFDTLPASGSATWTNDITLSGWFHARTGTGTTIVANDGSSNAGNLYSYGTGTNTDRALGSVGSGNAAVGNLFWGIRLTNDTGSTIASLDVSYIGEQWRNSAAAAQTIAFSYITGSSITGSLADFQAAGTNVIALDFTSPITGGVAGALDGNLAANRVALSTTISGVNLANGQSILLRWSDPDHTGADHGLSIDDFSVTANGGTPMPTLNINDVTQAEGDSGTSIFTFTVSLTGVAAGDVTFDIATADGTAQDDNPDTEDSDYVAKTETGRSITAGNLNASFTVTINGDTDVEPNETFFVNVTNVSGGNAGDLQGLGTINNDDIVATPIHDIQGIGTTSPLVGQVVTTIGIVTGVKSNGFFIQEPDAGADADPNTSEGIQVFTSSAPPAAAAIGNRVAVTGTVVEFIPGADPNSPSLTELGSPITVNQLSSGNPLPAAITITAGETTAPSETSDPLDTLEEYEGMRVTIPSLTAVSPTQGNINEPNATATSNGVFYGVVTSVARPFREAGIAISDPVPAPNPPNVPRFDENPERIRVDSDGQTGATAINLTTGTVVTGITGVVDFGFRTYTILPDAAAPPGVGPILTFTPVPAPAANELTVGAFNMQRFYDDVNDPGGDVVLTTTAFNNRLNKASLAIRNVMLTPDVIGIVEMENLSTLQAVANKVNADAVVAAQPNPNYQAFLSEGNDIGLIDVGFLVKTARVAVIDVTQFGLTDTYINPNTGLPELLNDRPPLVLRGQIPRPAGDTLAFTVIVNHLRSLNGIDDESPNGSGTEGARVRAKRRAQAEFLANLIQSRQTGNPTEKIISVGDYNAFQFNDGYVDSMGTIKGMPAPADQVVLPSSDLVNPDLTNLIDTLPADQRYSFTFDGNAQSLDHVLVNDDALALLNRFAYARNNADFPQTYYGDANRPERLSDHDMPVAYFTLGAQPAGSLLISEFRLRGPGPAGAPGRTGTIPTPASDEFIEFYNNTDANIIVATTDGSAGWALVASDGVARFTIPNGTAIPARGHYLVVNSIGYSLAAYPAGDGTTATGDGTYTTDIPDNAGLAIFNTSNAANFILANRLDAVGSASEANTLYKEGTGYPALSTSISPEYSFFRNMATGLPKDTDNNAGDFLFADTQATDVGAGRQLGAPGPENLSSPIQRNATIKASLVFPCVASTASPNRERVITPVTNGPLGTLEIRRKFTNNTGSPVTRLRFRIVDITTAIAPVGTADLRALTSTDVSLLAEENPCGTGALTLNGLTLEEPPAQPNAGGFNSSLSAGIVTGLAPIAPGATINLRFLLGVQQGGSFRFFVNVEALP